MIKAVVLPDKREFVFKEKRLRLRDVLERLGIDDLDSVAIIYNGHLIDDPDYIIESGGEVKIILQGIGG